MLPELDYKRIILAILLVMISAGLIFGIVWLIFLRPSGEIGREPGEITSGGGTLPGTWLGDSGNLAGQLDGRLPGEDLTGLTGGAEPGQILTQAEISEVAKGAFTKANVLNDESVKGVKKDKEVDSFNYLSAEDNKFYRISFENGEKILLAAEIFPFVDKVTWSPDGNKVVLQYPDGAAISYDFMTNKKTTLPTGLEGPSFDQSANNIAYKFISNREEDNWLVVTDTNSNQSRAVEAIGDQGDKVQVDWSPNNQVVALYRKSVGLEREEIFFIGLNDENYKSLVVEGSNFSGIWSPAGDKILYSAISSENNYNPILWIVDGEGDNIGNNNFNLGLVTWADKCAFSGDGQTVYCAVPISLPEAAGMYPEIINDSADVFYQINLETGVSKLIAYPVLSENLEKFQVKQLFVSDDNGKLFFWDNFTDKIYYLRLK